MRRTLVLALVLLGACAGGASEPFPDELGAPEAEVFFERDGREVIALEVWVADTPEARARGLMEVEEMPEDAGMVFLFDPPTQSGFWMKNTLIPLDIAFLLNDRVSEVLQMQPCDRDPCPIYRPQEPYDGAVEANLGVLSDVRPGDEVRVE